MINKIIGNLALGSVLFVAPGSAFDPPSFTKIEQNTRTVAWVSVGRATIAQSSSRRIRVTGPWMDYVTSVSTSGGISGRNISHEFQKVSLVLDATTSSARGNKSVALNITCPFGGELIGCTRGPVMLPIKVFESGPISSISPSGTVAANTQYTFELHGEGFDVAALLPRLLTLKDASVVSRDASTIRVKGITPSCGYIDVALTDQADGDEFPYRKGNALPSVLSGHICGTSLAPSSIGNSTVCPSGTNWDTNTKTCHDE
jgi:hypothetical protein